MQISTPFRFGFVGIFENEVALFLASHALSKPNFVWLEEIPHVIVHQHQSFVDLLAMFNEECIQDYKLK